MASHHYDPDYCIDLQNDNDIEICGDAPARDAKQGNKLNLPKACKSQQMFDNNFDYEKDEETSLMELNSEDLKEGKELLFAFE